MKNVLNEILNIISYDDKDEDEKLEEIKSLVKENNKEFDNLLLLEENVGLDIEAENFYLHNDRVDKEFYEEYYGIKS